MNWDKVRDQAEDQKRVLLLVGQIDSDQAVRIKKAVLKHNLSSEVQAIKLFIDSRGGDLEAALEIYDMFNLSSAPITGIVVGDCMSAATIILQACKKRISMRHSSFLVHYPSLRLNVTFEDGWEETLRLYMEKGTKMRERIEAIYRNRTKMPHEQIGEALLRGNKHYEVIDADRALDLGIIDEVLDKGSLFQSDPENVDPR